MEYGIILGAYFIVKFGFTVLSSKIPFLSLFSWVLLFGTPFVIFYILRNFRDKRNNGFLEFSKAWSLSLLLIFFASLPEALGQYIYFQFINPSYIVDQISQLSQTLESLGEIKNNTAINELINNYKNATPPSAIQMVFQGIFNNLFFGGLLSLIVAAIVKRPMPKNLSN
ncbi:MAG: DUF4199 domain-containing protein [Bacteroidales bacterium]